MSGFVLPRYVGGSARGWELADYVEVEKSSDKAVGGVTTLELPPVDDEERWLIDHAVTTCSSSSVTELRWFDSSVRTSSIIEQTDNGNFDVADFPVGLRLAPQRFLIFRWTGCSANAIGTVNLQIRILRRTQK